jgi:predicted nucleotide-binding protein
MSILIVEDDLFYSKRLAEALNDRGVETVSASSAQEALNLPDAFKAAVIDVMLPNDPDLSGISVEESRGGYSTGIAVARRLRKSLPDIKLALITGDFFNSEVERWAAEQKVPLLRKYDPLSSVMGTLQTMGIVGAKVPPKAFIVYGHDEVSLLQLKNYLQNVLKWREPIILREQANSGRTLIEKFEAFSGGVDCVFVLLTPDDETVTKTGTKTRRSRQNVIFEMGFFLAQMGRHSNRVVALYKGPNELPSDIQGVAWISIENGIDAAGEEIRREVQHLL